MSTVVEDDLLIAANMKKYADELVRKLKSIFLLTDMGQAIFTLGIHIEHDRKSKTLKLNQKLYLQNICLTKNRWLRKDDS